MFQEITLILFIKNRLNDLIKKIKINEKLYLNLIKLIIIATNVGSFTKWDHHFLKNVVDSITIGINV